MGLKRPAAHDSFWETLLYIENMKQEKSLDEVEKELNLSGQELEHILTYLKKYNFPIHLKATERGGFLSPPSDKEKGQFDLSVNEWLALQEHEGLLQKENPGELSLQNILAAQPLEKSYYQKLESIEFAIMKNFLLKYLVSGMKEGLFCYPHRIVKVDSDLCLVSEGLKAKSLVYDKIKDISKLVLHEEHNHSPYFSFLEVNQLIEGLREVGGQSLRLVLKINRKVNFNFRSPYHHLGRPCLISNSDGDKIWAATIEPSQDIFEWIYEMGENVEILDPLNFKVLFKEYCEKQKKMA